jgi:signal transduction histidine kinase
LELSFAASAANAHTPAMPDGWGRAGTRQSMAQILASETAPAGRLLAVIDEDNKSHAEWQSPRIPIEVEAGGALQVEWQCCFSIGLALETAPVTYDLLQPGRYVFRMNEVSLAGQPASGEASLLLIVTPPFWQKAWFLVLCGMAAAALVFGAVRYFEWSRTRREIATMRQQQTLDQERMRIARDLHDEIGANLTHISILGTIASREGVAVPEMRTKCLEVAEVARETIRACSEIVWSVNPLNDTLGSVIRHLTLYAQEYLQSAGIASVIDTERSDADVRLNPKVRHELLMTFKEALQNVVKHSKADEVRLSFALKSDTLCVRIADDGQGFDVAACSGSEGFHGNGIRNMTERVREIAGDLVIESGLEKGTTVCVTISVK